MVVYLYSYSRHLVAVVTSVKLRHYAYALSARWRDTMPVAPVQEAEDTMPVAPVQEAETRRRSKFSQLVTIDSASPLAVTEYSSWTKLDTNFLKPSLSLVDTSREFGFETIPARLACQRIT